jgi:GDP-L-fucose synthase
LHADDLAKACLYLLANYDGEVALNIGTGIDVTIAELAHEVAKTVGYGGDILWDASKPDGTPRKLLDTSAAAELGWLPEVSLSEGLRATLRSYISALKS